MGKGRTLIAVLVAFTAGWGAHGAEPAPVTLLFAGSSSTYWNDLPREVAKAVDGKLISAPGAQVRPEVVGRSGDDIRVYLQDGFNRYEYGVKPGQTFLQKLADERPRLVVLQVVCAFVLADDNRPASEIGHAAAITKYCAAIREAGGEPVFYEMGWGQTEREAEGRRRILKLAQENRIKFFAPCSTAWATVARDRPELELQHPQDRSHPGDLGHFLNLACFYAALTGKPPTGVLPREYPVWPHALGKLTTPQEIEAEEKRLAAFQPDEYQVRLAKWMRRPMSLATTHKLSDETARYLEQVAFTVWQETRTALGGEK